MINLPWDAHHLFVLQFKKKKKTLITSLFISFLLLLGNSVKSPTNPHFPSNNENLFSH